jgi:hypothetical protein
MLYMATLDIIATAWCDTASGTLLIASEELDAFVVVPHETFKTHQLCHLCRDVQSWTERHSLFVVSLDVRPHEPISCSSDLSFGPGSHAAQVPHTIVTGPLISFFEPLFIIQYLPAIGLCQHEQLATFDARLLS